MERYKILKNLGDGTYGTVFKAENKETGEIVAIKKMKRKYKNWDECMALREVKSLRKMNHPNLVKLKEVLQVKDELMLVFEYVDLNIYQMYMTYKEKKTHIPEKTIKKLLFQMALGLDALHKIGFFHRDLKPENLLINMKTLNVKLCDFGLAREVRCRPPFTEYVSTRWYRAPEILLHSQTYNSPVDIFALGCIMAELYNLSPLFSGANELDQFFKMVNTLGTPQNWQEGIKLAQKSGMTIPKRESVPLQQVVPRASPEAIQLLSDMLQYDPQKRPTALQITKYPYFDEIQREFGDFNPANIITLQSAPTSSLYSNSLQKQQSISSMDCLNEMPPLQKYQSQNINNQSSIQHQQQQLQQQQQQYSNNISSLNKLNNPFQQYKDEYLKNQNQSIYSKPLQENSSNFMQKRPLNMFDNLPTQPPLQMFNPAASTNYHFGKRNSNNNNTVADQNGMPMVLGGTLERPLNINYLNEASKAARKQNMLLKKTYGQDSQNQLVQSQSQLGLEMQQSQQQQQLQQQQGGYSPRQNELNANNIYNQFNKVTMQNYPYKNNNLNDNKRESQDQGGSNLNKIFEDKLNWAF